VKIPKKSNPLFFTFKGLYEEPKKIAGQIYWPIKEAFGFVDKSKVQRGDVSVFEVAIQGNKKAAYLFTGPPSLYPDPRVKRLVVRTHGRFSPCQSGGGMMEDIIQITPKMPIITLLGPHREMLSSGIDATINNTYAQLSSEGITLSSKQAQEHIRLDYEKITGTKTTSAIRNYILSKLDTVPPVGSAAYVAHVFEAYAAYVSHSRSKEESQFVDIITLRRNPKRVPESGATISHPQITLREMLIFAQERGYAEIILSFCRCSEVSTIFDVKQTVLLPKAITIPWNQVSQVKEPRTKESRELDADFKTQISNQEVDRRPTL
jgi:hypothetical protein